MKPRVDPHSAIFLDFVFQDRISVLAFSVLKLTLDWAGLYPPASLCISRVLELKVCAATTTRHSAIFMTPSDD